MAFQAREDQDKLAVRSGTCAMETYAQAQQGCKPSPYVYTQLYGQPAQQTTTSSMSSYTTRRPESFSEVLSGEVSGPDPQLGPAFVPLFSPVEADQAKLHDIQSSLRHVSVIGPSLDSSVLPPVTGTDSDTSLGAGVGSTARRKSQDAACQTEPELYGSAPGPTSRMRGSTTPSTPLLSPGLIVIGTSLMKVQGVNEKGRQVVRVPPGQAEGYEGMSEREPVDNGRTPLLSAQPGVGVEDQDGGRQVHTDVRPVSLGDELTATLAELEEAFGIHAVGPVQMTLPHTLLPRPSDEDVDGEQVYAVDEGSEDEEGKEDGGLDAYARAVEAQEGYSQQSSSRNSNEAIPDEALWASSPSMLLRHDLTATPNARGSSGFFEGMQAMATEAAGSPARRAPVAGPERVTTGTVSLGFDTEGLDSAVPTGSTDESPLRVNMSRYAPLPRSPAGRSPSIQLRAQAHAGQAALSAGRRRAAASREVTMNLGLDAGAGNSEEHLPTGQPTSEAEGSLLEPGFPISAMPMRQVISGTAPVAASAVSTSTTTNAEGSDVGSSGRPNHQRASSGASRPDVDTPLPVRLAQL